MTKTADRDDGWCRHRRCINGEWHFAGENGGLGDECAPFQLASGECECREPARYGTLPDPRCTTCSGTGYLPDGGKK